jgi:hypothetical protein
MYTWVISTAQRERNEFTPEEIVIFFQKGTLHILEHKSIKTIIYLDNFTS